MTTEVQRTEGEADGRNQALFEQIADVIEEQPEAYDQGQWGRMSPECGTRACVAGWALMKGAPEKVRWRQWGTGRWGARATSGLYEITTDDGMFITCHARDLLGLTSDEADVLFHLRWRPPEHMTVPEALRKLGAGAPVAQVTDQAVFATL